MLRDNDGDDMSLLARGKSRTVKGVILGKRVLERVGSEARRPTPATTGERSITRGALLPRGGKSQRPRAAQGNLVPPPFPRRCYRGEGLSLAALLAMNGVIKPVEVAGERGAFMSN